MANKVSVLSAITALCHGVAVSGQATGHNQMSFDEDGPGAVGRLFKAPTRYIIKYRDNGSKDNVFRQAKSLHGEVKLELEDLNAVAMEFPDDSSVKSLEFSDDIEYIEVDHVRWPMVEPEDFSKSSSSSSSNNILGLGSEETLSADSAEKRRAQATPLIDLYGLRMVESEIVQQAGGSARSTPATVPVCIMDTGYTPEHSDLPERPFAVGDPSPVGACNTRACCCDKQGQCSSCTTSPCNCAPSLTQQVCRSSVGCPTLNPWNDASGHGTHVAGTVLALENGGGVKGVCPTCRPVVVRVFNDAGHFSYASEVAGAALACQRQGAKIINMSLGGGAATQLEWTTFSRLNSQGMIVFASSGNAGNSVISYPAGYSGVLGVGAVGEDMKRARFSQYNHAVDITAPGVDVVSSYPLGRGSFGVRLGMTTTAGVPTGSIRKFGGSATGVLPPTLMCHTGLMPEASDNCRGKICLTPRGEHTFQAKVDACKRHGGVASVIYNNVAEPYASAVDQPDEWRIFVVALAQIEGQNLAAALESNASITASIEIGGPTDYSALSGTSMSSPHAAGVAGLLWSKHPRCDAETIRSAMLASAIPLPAGTAGNCPAETPASHCHGRGLANAFTAMDYLCSRSFSCLDTAVCTDFNARKPGRSPYVAPTPEPSTDESAPAPPAGEAPEATPSP
uniref:subtilisin n=1 Tax=Chromera velia CCMP2878 TaxID=1169474 RepID=A0A0G4HNJ9_9ALVE|eukprot:Cvel_7632.t1-p1 / transcript=Cvel_7632.t1 / gene=Cvel_7632 / organism=Chromera_velia_CCMP2878 / gene_product=Subtilisin DY, putative / transcript_product=Subtilisin DY, putative / location=Cvel_scaffold403:41141-44787(-) / protein_length=677 / sequence_SO=supercontig / SO=protein_coding / is_pseudo=false